MATHERMQPIRRLRSLAWVLVEVAAAGFDKIFRLTYFILRIHTAYGFLITANYLIDNGGRTGPRQWMRTIGRRGSLLKDLNNNSVARFYFILTIFMSLQYVTMINYIEINLLY